MDQVGRVLRALAVVVAVHRVFDVLLQNDPDNLRIAGRTAVAVHEVGIIEVGLELADVAVVLVDAALVGCGDRTLVTAGPLAEHAGRVAVALHNLRKDDVVGVIGLLSRDGILPVLPIHHLAAPILAVAADMPVARVLPGHQRRPRGGTHRTSGIGLREEHPLAGHAVEVGRLDVFLPVTSQIAVSHVVAQDENDIRLCIFFRRTGIRHESRGDQSGAQQHLVCTFHLFSVLDIENFPQHTIRPDLIYDYRDFF